MEYEYKKAQSDVETRRTESLNMRERFPDRIPVICEKGTGSKLYEIKKSKFLIPVEATMAHLTSNIRNKLKLEKQEALFILVSGKYSVSGDKTMNEIYYKYMDPEDGFLYITYTNELTWG